jgi:MFS family permease
MTFALVFTQHLPTLALVSIGASELAVGIQNGLGQALQPAQLLALRAVARLKKRRILILGQCFAVVGALPLVFFGSLTEWAGGGAVVVAMLCFAWVALGLVVSNTVWFPLLRGYVESDRIGRFFGVLRSGWHLSLILYYLAAQQWLRLHPGAFGPLFLAGWFCGLLRIALISWLPERSERTGGEIRIREALTLLREQRSLRRYLMGITTTTAVRLCVLPFLLVMMRREVGFSDAEVLTTTVALFSGGLVSLYLWGHVVDRLGPAPVFRWTAFGSSLLILTLIGVQEPDGPTLLWAVAVVFGISVLSSGFGVADTRVLFELTPADAPARTLVAAQVTVTVVAGLAPVLVGFALEQWLASAEDRLAVYHVFFSAAAVVRALAYLPLRSFEEPTT